MTNHQDTRREKANPFAKNTYRVLNEPYKLLGIYDCAMASAPLFLPCSLGSSAIP